MVVDNTARTVSLILFLIPVLVTILQRHFLWNILWFYSQDYNSASRTFHTKYYVMKCSTFQVTSGLLWEKQPPISQVLPLTKNINICNEEMKENDLLKWKFIFPSSFWVSLALFLKSTCVHSALQYTWPRRVSYLSLFLSVFLIYVCACERQGNAFSPSPTQCIELVCSARMFKCRHDSSFINIFGVYLLALAPSSFLLFRFLLCECQ